jgi:hypothetical protein
MRSWLCLVAIIHLAVLMLVDLMFARAPAQVASIGYDSLFVPGNVGARLRGKGREKGVSVLWNSGGEP